RVIHFEIPVENPEKSIPFYSDLFGWKIDKWGGPGMDYWLITTGPKQEEGINGGMMKRNPGQPVANTIQVDSVDEMCRKIEAKGGVICVPKMVIPGVGYLAYFQDPDGNIFGIMHPDLNAK